MTDKKAYHSGYHVLGDTLVGDYRNDDVVLTSEKEADYVNKS